MEKKKFNQKELKSLEAIREMVNSTPIQPIYKRTFRKEFHVLGDVGDVKSVHGLLTTVDADERNWSDEDKKKYEELLKQKLLPVIEEMYKKCNEEIEAIVMEEVEKIKAVKKNIENDLETIRKKTRELEQVCAFIDKLFD